NRLKEVQPSYIYQQLPFQVQRSAVGMFLIEVARKAIPESEPNPELFNFLHRFLQYIDQSKHSLVNIPSFFLIQLSAFLGFTPSLEQAEIGFYFDLKEGTYTPVAPIHQNYLEPDTAQHLSDLIQIELESLANIHIPKKTREQLLKGLLDYFSLHLDHFSTIHSHKILKTVLE
ncbi:MAG: DNA repair protein RecO C-terminal domain-containing protein, partial [Bacteroidota bacterium]